MVEDQPTKKILVFTTEGFLRIVALPMTGFVGLMDAINQIHLSGAKVNTVNIEEGPIKYTARDVLIDMKDVAIGGRDKLASDS